MVVGTLFPNFSFVNPGGGPTEFGGPSEDGISIRIWHPLAADRTEIWVWNLAYREGSAAEQAAADRAILRTFGSAGLYEPDDTEIWERMQAGMRGVRARQQWLEFRPHLTSDQSWPHPGFARRGPQGEHRQVHFYEKWLAMVTAEDKPTDAKAVVR
jgi:hypothetical protein